MAADWTKNMVTHDWSTMRATWQTKRDSFHVPKGAGGVSIGDAIKAVATAQGNGLKPFSMELPKFELKLDKYKAAIAKKAAKPPKNPKDPNYKGLSDWITKDFEAWIKADKQAAKNETLALKEMFTDITKAQVPLTGNYRLDLLTAGQDSAKAQGLNLKDLNGSEDIPFVKADTKRVTTALADVTTALDGISAACAAATKGYGKHLPAGIAAALAKTEDDVKDFEEYLTNLVELANWEQILIAARDMDARSHGVTVGASHLVTAVKTRFGM